MPTGEKISKREPESSIYLENCQLNEKKRRKRIILLHTSGTPEVPFEERSISTEILAESKIVPTPLMEVSENPKLLKEKGHMMESNASDINLQG